MSELRKKLENILYQYIDLFEKKHDIFYDGAAGDDILGILLFGDYFFNITDIVYDIDNNLPEGMIFEWYNMNVEHETNINLHSYHKGYRL